MLVKEVMKEKQSVKGEKEKGTIETGLFFSQDDPSDERCLKGKLCLKSAISEVVN